MKKVDVERVGANIRAQHLKKSMLLQTAWSLWKMLENYVTLIHRLKTAGILVPSAATNGMWQQQQQ